MRTRLLLALALSTLFICRFASSACAQLVISEVYYCHATGGDDGFEWIELYNGTANPISLEGYILANGGLDYGWSVHVFGPGDLVPACATYVVGGPGSVVVNGEPIFNKVVNFTEDLQNGGVVADAVALFAPGANVRLDTPLDAVIYGESNSNGLLDETGQPGTPDVGNVLPGQSIERLGMDGPWIVQALPDPNDTAFLSEVCGPIGEGAESWGRVKALFRD